MDTREWHEPTEPHQGELNLGRPDDERSLLADLLEGSRLYHSSEDYLELLELVSRLRNFAPFNAMLLEVQKPGLTYAASKWDWKLRINATHGLNVQFVTLTHELGHLFLGHLGPDRYLKVAKRPALTHVEKELEAESLAFLVCKRHGVTSKSESYLANLVAHNPTVDSLDLETLLKAAGQVETVLGIAAETLFEPKPRPPKGKRKAKNASAPVVNS